MPFMATWKKEPNCRNGMKKSADSRITISTPASGNDPKSAKRKKFGSQSYMPAGYRPPTMYCQIATMMPAADPP